MTLGRLGEQRPAPDTPRFDAELGRYLAARTQQQARPAFRTGRWLAAVSMAVAAAVAVLIVWPVTGQRPPSVAQAGTFALGDGTKIPFSEFHDPANFEALRKRFADADATLVINEVPVAPAAVRRVLEIAEDFGDPLPSADDNLEVLVVEPGDRVEVTVGRAARDGEQVTTEGLTLYEVFPLVQRAVRFDDPVATGEALNQLGFKVRWVLVTFKPDGSFPPTEGQRVDAPPPGTAVLSVLGPNGEGVGVDPGIDTLTVEVTTDKAEAGEHAGAGSVG